MNNEAYKLLRAKYPENECILVHEVADSTSRRRYLDFMVINLWESRGQSIMGFEVKSYRSDWIKELKTPEKQELHVPYCDYFYLLITDEKVAKVDEIPENWGLMVVKGGKLHTVKKAPKLKSIPMPRSMWLSIVRRAADKTGFVHETVVQDMANQQLDNALKRINVIHQEKSQAYDWLKQKVDNFQKSLGEDVITRGDFMYRGKDIGAKLKFVLTNDHSDMLERFKRLKQIADSLISSSEQGIALFTEQPKSKS